MATKVGAIFIDFFANTAKMKADLGKAERSIKGFSSKANRALAVVEKAGRRLGRSFGRLGKSVFSLKGGIASLVGAAGIGLLIKRSLDAGDTIAKVADSIGISTDALQEYRFAADLAGVSQEALDGAFSAFTKRLGEARSGTGTLITILKKFDATLLENLKSAGSTEEAIQIYFRALGKVGNAADKAALASAAFGRTAGVAMVNLVKKGADEIDRMRVEAQRLGAVIDEKLLRGAEKAKDQLSILGTVLRVNVTSAVLKLAPEITRLAGSFTTLVPAIFSAGAEALKFFGILERAPLEKFDKLTQRIERLRTLEKRRRAGVGSGTTPTFFDMILPDFTNAKAGIKILERERAKLKQQVDSLMQQNLIDDPNLIKIPKTVAPKVKKTRNTTKDALKAATAAAREHKRELDKIRSAAQSVFEGTRTPLEQYQIRIKGLNDLVSVGAIDWDTYGRAVNKAQDQLDANARSLDAVRDGFKEVGVAALDSLGSIVTGATSARDALAGMLNVLSRIFSRVAGTALEKLIDGAFKSSPGGKNITLSPASTGFAPTGFNANDPLTRFAHGGEFTVGGAGGTDSQTVAFRATPGESVSVRTPAQQRGGGGDTFVNIDLRGSNGSEELRRTVRQGIAAAAPFIVDSAVETVRDGAGRTKKFFPGR